MIGIYFVKITQNEGTHQVAFSFFKMFPFPSTSLFTNTQNYGIIKNR